jgi:hypothetical protein
MLSIVTLSIVTLSIVMLSLSKHYRSIVEALSKHYRSIVEALSKPPSTAFLPLCGTQADSLTQRHWPYNTFSII